MGGLWYLGTDCIKVDGKTIKAHAKDWLEAKLDDVDDSLGQMTTNWFDDATGGWFSKLFDIM